MHIVAFDFNLQVDRYLVIVHPNIAKISKIQVENLWINRKKNSLIDFIADKICIHS